jgi:hypothetical protein
VGFTPKDEHIDHYLSIIEGAVSEIEKLPPQAVNDTRSLRVAAAREVYAHPEHIDWRRLALLEIFEGGTFKNLCRNPRAAVLWTGDSPVFVSFRSTASRGDRSTRATGSLGDASTVQYEPFHVVQTIFHLRSGSTTEREDAGTVPVAAATAEDARPVAARAPIVPGAP